MAKDMVMRQITVEKEHLIGTSSENPTYTPENLVFFNIREKKAVKYAQSKKSEEFDIFGALAS